MIFYAVLSILRSSRYCFFNYNLIGNESIWLYFLYRQSSIRPFDGDIWIIVPTIPVRNAIRTTGPLVYRLIGVELNHAREFKF